LTLSVESVGRAIDSGTAAETARLSVGAVMVKGTGAEPDRKHGARNPRLLVFLLATKRHGACTKARGDIA
jgi:hypothetical protein